MRRGFIVVTNRAEISGPCQWIHIVPRGELPNEEAGIVQVLDDTALDSILENLNEDKRREGDKWPGLYAGIEHHIYSPDQSSVALAWFYDFQKRADGIWANADGLNDLGREAIEKKKFKYTSFVANRSDLEPLGNNRFRVLKIDTVGFTNLANGKKLLTPITNRRGVSPDNQRRDLAGEIDQMWRALNGQRSLQPVANPALVATAPTGTIENTILYRKTMGKS